MIDDALANVHQGFGFAGAVAAATSTGLIGRWVRGRNTTEGYARALSLDPRATRCLLDVLVAFELATRDRILGFAERVLAADRFDPAWAAETMRA